jgi:putative colanic acid biosynthesis acetyltransferase WcaF
LPGEFRGRNIFIVQLWNLTYSLLFKTSPQILYFWRRFLLRLFGAQIGSGVRIRSSAHIYYPWKVSVGNNSWIGDRTELYSLGTIKIGENVVISQRSYLCTGSHDYSDATFSIWQKPIILEDEVWVATDVFIGPGVKIDKGAVIGSRSSVYKNMPAGMICVGNPAIPIKERIGKS